MARIQLRDVTLRYDAPPDPVHRLLKVEQDRIREDLPETTGRGIVALDHVDLTVPNGRTFAVVGPSGCGKSTLLRVIAGLNTDYSGQVLYDGEDVQTIHPKDRQVGMVFQGYALYPNFDGQGNLSFFFRVNKIGDEQTRERIQYTSDLMGIGFNELLPRSVGTLSGGEKQRVAIARAIVRAPRVLLLDEPLSNLDAKLRIQTRSEIKRLLHRFSITSLYVTHDQVEAVALADEIVVMHRGRVEQVGTYTDLLENPVNSFVAGFLGLPPMSLLPGAEVSGGRLALGEHILALREPLASRVRGHHRVVLGMRPEAVQILREQPPAGSLYLPAEVEASEADYAHRTQTVHVRSGGWKYAGLCPLEITLRPAQPVFAQLDPARLYFFDPASGLRL